MGVRARRGKKCNKHPGPATNYVSDIINPNQHQEYRSHYSIVSEELYSMYALVQVASSLAPPPAAKNAVPPTAPMLVAPCSSSSLLPHTPCIATTA